MRSDSLEPTSVIHGEEEEGEVQADTAGDGAPGEDINHGHEGGVVSCPG